MQIELKNILLTINKLKWKTFLCMKTFIEIDSYVCIFAAIVYASSTF